MNKPKNTRKHPSPKTTRTQTQQKQYTLLRFESEGPFGELTGLNHIHDVYKSTLFFFNPGFSTTCVDHTREWAVGHIDITAISPPVANY